MIQTVLIKRRAPRVDQRADESPIVNGFHPKTVNIAADVLTFDTVKPHTPRSNPRMTSRDLSQLCLTPDQSLTEALERMNQTGLRAVLVVDDAKCLLGLITDGDVRKSMLRGMPLSASVVEMMNPDPYVTEPGLPETEYYALMIRLGNECLPVVDADRRVLGMIFLRDFVETDARLQSAMLETSMVIMAGGQGKRLWPLTKDTPKPLLPVANRPLLTHILEHARSQGFRNIWVSTHYKSEQFERYVEEDAPDGLDITVIKEEDPLGTAGGLKALQTQMAAEGADVNADSDKPLFVMNGDILTRLDFQSMLKWHQEHKNLMTVACRQFTYTVPYGVLETEADGQQLTSIAEKPVKCFNINAGIYLIEREALGLIPADEFFDMTDLIEAVIAVGKPVGTFPISEPWIDIGQHADYERVQRESDTYIPAAG